MINFRQSGQLPKTSSSVLIPPCKLRNLVAWTEHVLFLFFNEFFVLLSLHLHKDVQSDCLARHLMKALQSSLAVRCHLLFNPRSSLNQDQAGFSARLKAHVLQKILAGDLSPQVHCPVAAFD